MAIRASGRAARGAGTQPVRRRRPLRRLVATLLLVALLAGGLVLVQSRLDQQALRTRLERQVYESTGRTLTLGALHIALLPVPTVVASDIALSDMQDGGRAAMLTASGLSAHLALWPLVHHVARLEGVTLTAPDLLLERDADGRANWQFHRVPAQQGASSPADATAGTAEPWAVEVGSVRLRDGTVAWRDKQHGWTGNARIDQLDGTGLAGSDPVVDLAGHHGGAGFTAHLATGALAGITEAGASPWPVHLLLRTERNERQDTSLSVDGTLGDPARLRGYALDIALKADRPDGIGALFPHAALPALGPLSLNARLVDGAAEDAAAASPRLDRLSLRAAQIDAGALLHRAWSQGLTIDTLSIEAPNRTAPLALSADGAWQGRALTLSGTAGTLDDWRGGLAGPGKAPFDLALGAGDARLSLKGVANAGAAELAVQAKIPSLRALSSVGPALTDLSLASMLTVGPGRSLALSGLTLESRQIGLRGQARIEAAPDAARPAITAALTASHVDVDALRAGWRRPALETPRAPVGEAAPPAAPSAAPPAAPAPPALFAPLLQADLALTLDADAVTFDGDAYKGLAATVSLHDGVLSLSPFSVTGPAGPIAGRFGADAGRQSVSFGLSASMLPARTLARWLGKPPVLDGTAELVADLHSDGATGDALVAAASGHAGLSMVDGSIGNAALAALVGRPADLPDQGSTGFRCLALPATLSGGVATLSPLALSTSRLEVEGRGTVRLLDGGLDLHLLPHLSIGSAGASLPVRVGGTLSAPVAALDPAAPGGRFALTIGGAGDTPDPCAAALSAARFGAAGPAAGAAPQAGKHKLPRPIDILRGLGLFH